ncbi:MAG: DUF2218 domain-containing protein [Pseudomonadota bacterium]
MYSIETRVRTANASRYLQQLCKHWAHRIEIVFTPNEARVPFNEEAVCLLGADDGGLDVRIDAPDASEAARLGQVVVEHLKRFAFREPLEAPVWRLAS